jgi:hypothetical protein
MTDQQKANDLLCQCALTCVHRHTFECTPSLTHTYILTYITSKGHLQLWIKSCVFATKK